jgi:ABC-2 type transport system permease protein
MTSPLIYDFRKTLTSKSFALIIIVMILLGFLTVYSSGSASSIQGVNNGNVALWDYYTGSGYRFVGYTFDAYGTPISGANYSVTAYVNSSKTFSGGGITNSSGFVTFTMPIPGLNRGAGLQATVSIPGGGSWSQQTQLQSFMPSCEGCNQGQLSAWSPTNPVTTIYNGSKRSGTELFVTELGPTGQPPRGWGLYYKFVTGQPSQQLTPSQMQLLGRLNDIQTILPVPPEGTTKEVVLAIFDTHSNLVWMNVSPYSQLTNTQNVPGRNPCLWEHATASAFYLVGYTYDEFGVPVSGVNYSISLSVGAKTLNVTALTNSSGYVAFAIPASTSNGADVGLSVTFPGQQQGQGWAWSGTFQGYSTKPQLGGMTLGGVQSIGTVAAAVVDITNKSQLEMDFVSLGANGTVPQDLGLYYKYSDTVPSWQEIQGMNASEMILLGHLSGMSSILPMPPPPSDTSKTLITGLFTPSGATVSITPSQVVRLPDAGLRLSTALIPDLLLFTPVVGILASFSAYGRDRISGILTSIITRPVSRRGLAISRYISVLILLAVASFISVEAMNLFCTTIIGIPLNLSYQLALVLGVFVEATAYAGLIFVLSRLVRSLPAILGGAALVYVLTNFVVILFSIPNSFVVAFDMLDPGRYVEAFISYITNTNFLNITPNPTHFDPATVGLSPISLSAGAALWVLVPFAAFLYLSVKRD